MNPFGEIVAEASGSVAETMFGQIDEDHLTWSTRPDAVSSIEEHRALQSTLQQGGADANTVEPTVTSPLRCPPTRLDLNG